MCGIIGQINFSGSVTTLPKLSKIGHRGPDGQGEWTNAEGNVYLGHTRLAIIEPTPAGRQPMHDAKKQFTITFNGEIYNHQCLRNELPGIVWRSTSDTETLVELIGSKGLQALSLIKGMFAFALHNSRDNSVLLVRDRLGIKPLWFKRTSEAFSFCSEIRPLVDQDKVAFTTKALSEYIGFGRMPNTEDVIENIASVPPGGWMRIFPNGRIEKGNWWPTSSFSVQVLNSQQEAAQRVKALLTTAIEEHLISDVGVGAFLSGGIDSSIVTLVAGKVLGKRLGTFTVGFPQGAFDERKIARAVAEKAGSDHNEIEVTETDCLEWVKEAVANMDIPSVDAINTFIVSKAVTDKGLKVALSGLGGDELFGGYPSFKNVPSLSFLERLPVTVSRILVSRMPASLKEKLSGLQQFTPVDLTVARRRFTSVLRLNSLGLSNGTPSIAPAPSGLDKMGSISWAEMQGYMIPMLLRDSDQMSMAVALEIRVPFLDHKLVEEVLSMKETFKKGAGLKSLLVEAFRDELPIEVYDRPKQGFGLPMNDWIKGPLAQFTNIGLQAAADRLQMKEPIQLKKKFDEGALHWTRIWNWSVLGYWLLRQEEQNPQGTTVAISAKQPTLI